MVILISSATLLCTILLSRLESLGVMLVELGYFLAGNNENVLKGSCNANSKKNPKSLLIFQNHYRKSYINYLLFLEHLLKEFDTFRFYNLIL